MTTPHSSTSIKKEYGLSSSLKMEHSSYDSHHTDLSQNSCDIVVADQWVVLNKIGEGSFGEVFEVRDVNTGRHYAIKRESLKMKHPQLKHEHIMYDVLAGGPGIPQCHWYGQFDGFDCIILDLLGPNINQLRENVKDIPLDVVLDLGCQMVTIVEHIHQRGVIFRDVKPDNFLFASKCHLPEPEMIESMDESGMPTINYKKLTCHEVFEKVWGYGQGEQYEYPKIYAVDYGLACYWRDPETGKALPDVKKHIRNKTGTARYASINVHRGKSHSRRDDIESIGYILLDLLLGTLPWTGVQAKNSKAGWDRMRQLKVDTFMSDLCAGLPKGILQFIEYPRKLQFMDQPDYDYLRQLLKGSLPGGPYDDVVVSPFGGQAKSKDYYQHEHSSLHQQRQQQQQHGSKFNHYNRYQKTPTTRSGGMKKDKDDENETKTDRDLFNLNDLHQQITTIERSNPIEIKETSKNKQRKNSMSSQSSFQKLLKRNKVKKIGWNTHKHDQIPWDPQIDWVKDENRGDEDSTTTLQQQQWGDEPYLDETGGGWGLPSKIDEEKEDVIEKKWKEASEWVKNESDHVNGWQHFDLDIPSSTNNNGSWQTTPQQQQPLPSISTSTPQRQRHQSTSRRHHYPNKSYHKYTHHSNDTNQRQHYQQQPFSPFTQNNEENAEGQHSSNMNQDSKKKKKQPKNYHHQHQYHHEK
ncbi:kinase-like domain-containing protein [Cunninghamella echinulata]|nr:kinase-like domain-containing protein [Cunninghamella echinulata]